MTYLNTDWYAKQLRDLTKPCAPHESAGDDDTRAICQRAYMAPEGFALYDGRTKMPSRAIMSLSDDVIDDIARNGWTRTPELPFRAGNISSTIRAGTVLSPADYFMAGIITTVIGERPIYFALPTEAFDTLNLRPFMLRQGVAAKLNNGPLTRDHAAGIAELGPEYQTRDRFVDVARTDTLLNEVYLHRGGFPDEWTRWTDAATEGVPAYYAASYAALAAGYHSMGRQEELEDSVQNAIRFSRLANLRQPEQPGAAER